MMTRYLFHLVGLLAVAVASGGNASAAGDDLDSITLPNGVNLTEVDFERHVASLFGKLGCNAANCHGSFQGRGGLRLSLFGYSAKMDYEAFTADPSLGRIDRQDAEFSLMLLKPSGGDEHEGGIRFEADSWEYRVFERWISTGAEWKPGTGSVQRLIVAQGPSLTMRPGEAIGLTVRAEFTDGTEADVTPLAGFRSNNESIAHVGASGEISARQSGDTSIIVSYRGAYVAVPVLVPIPVLMPHTPHSPDGDDPARRDHVANPIDRLIDDKLQQMNLSPSPTCDDATFLRRVTLDTIGALPTPDEVLEFLSDPDPGKKERKIDELLAHPMHAALWATRMCDITGCNVDTLPGPDPLKTKRAKMWHDWFRVRFAENVSYDRIAFDVICATSRDDAPIDDWMDDQIARVRAAEQGFETDYAQRRSLDLFWQRTGANGQFDLEDQSELVATAFMGVRMNCARCHKHPFDRWSQLDYLALANVFAGVRFDSSTELRGAMLDRLDARRQANAQGAQHPKIPRLREVYLGPPSRHLRDEETGDFPVPRAPLGPEFGWEQDPREQFARWLTAPDNPFFAPSFVNRVWSIYLGRGIVEPVDAFSVANPPSHPQLLEHLAREFTASGFDIRRLERAILTSATYQRSAHPAGNNALDQRNFSRALVRPLLAEVVLDSIDLALGGHTDLGVDGPSGSRVIELATNRPAERQVASALSVFGRGERTSLCDCDRSTDPSLRQPLYLMSDVRLLEKIESSRLADLIEANATDREIVEQFFLATLSRLPDDEEWAFARQHLAEAADRQTGLVDVVWGLINTREFITNH